MEIFLGDSKPRNYDLFKNASKSIRKKNKHPNEKETQMAKRHENMLNFPSKKTHANGKNSDSISHLSWKQKGTRQDLKRRQERCIADSLLSDNKLAKSFCRTHWPSPVILKMPTPYLSESTYRQIFLRTSLLCARIFTASLLVITKRCPPFALWTGKIFTHLYHRYYKTMKSTGARHN